MSYSQTSNNECLTEYKEKIHLNEHIATQKSAKIYGYASIFNIIDKHSDVIKPGAFNESLRSYQPKLLWQHKHHHPIGYWEKVVENNVGLWVEGQIMLNLRLGNEAYALIASKAINGLSIGYRVIDYDTKNGLRYLKKLELLEISIVTFPANPFSKVNV